MADPLSLLRAPAPFVSSRKPIAFAGSWLNRSDPLRSDPAALEALKGKGARLLCLDGLEPDLAREGALHWAGLEAAPAEAELVFLGLDEEGAGCFAAVPAPDTPNRAAGQAMWDALSLMTHGDIATYGTARALVGWHARHRFCARCGAPTVLAKGGWQRSCIDEACGGEHFPRVDPVVIMSVEHDGHLLLGRQPRFPARRYSTLAGFLEPGESLEESVAREIFEEAGLTLSEVRYVASQPWPFPSSLMFGCHAIATDSALRIDYDELEDARWFTRAQVAEAMAARARGEEGEAFAAPMPHAIAWHLIDRWLND